VCAPGLPLPLLSKKGLSNRNLTSVSSTDKGDGEILFAPTYSDVADNGTKDIVLVFRMYHDANFAFPAGVAFADAPNYRVEVDRILLNCDQHLVTVLQSEYYNELNKLVFLTFAVSPAVAQQYSDQSPYAVLGRMVCSSAEVRQ
jgi:hypothetical protein